jgi:hypothetical protein
MCRRSIDAVSRTLRNWHHKWPETLVALGHFLLALARKHKSSSRVCRVAQLKCPEQNCMPEVLSSWNLSGAIGAITPLDSGPRCSAPV